MILLFSLYLSPATVSKPATTCGTNKIKYKFKMAAPAFNLNASLVRDDPALFFAQLDLFFKQKAITDQAEKFCYVASILPQDTITEV